MNIRLFVAEWLRLLLKAKSIWGGIARTIVVLPGVAVFPLTLLRSAGFEVPEPQAIIPGFSPDKPVHIPLVAMVTFYLAAASATGGAAWVLSRASSHIRMGEELEPDLENFMFRLRVWNDGDRNGFATVKVTQILDDSGQSMERVPLPLELEWSHHREMSHIEVPRGPHGETVGVVGVTLGDAPPVLRAWGARHKGWVFGFNNPVDRGKVYLELVLDPEGGKQVSRWFSLTPDSKSPLGYTARAEEPPNACSAAEGTKEYV
ncbi:MAG TPA: hypothetical protein VHS06_03690 [Chloroflexota bacterium]|nr:hypothetical protein [Chloroflexota bacterium]